MSAARQVGAIAVHHLHRVLRGGAPVWLVVIPLALIYVLGVTMHGFFAAEYAPPEPYRVLVAPAQGAQDAGERAAAVAQRAVTIVEYVSHAREYFSASLAAAEQARRAVLDRTADVAVIVSDEEPQLTIVAPPESIAAASLAHHLRRFLAASGSEQSGLEQSGSEQGFPPSGAAGREIQAPAGTVTPAGTAAPAESMAAGAGTNTPWSGAGAFEYFSIAITVMFMTFAAHSAMTYSAQDRKTGAYLRIRSMGVSRGTYLAGGVVSAAAIGTAFALTMAVVTGALFRVDWGDPVAWFLMTVTGAASIAALSFCIMAVLPANPKTVESAGGTIYTLLAFLGGSTVPLNIMPDWFARLFAWLPNRRMLDAFLAIAQGASVQAVSGDLAALAGIAAALLAAGWAVLAVARKEGV